MQSSTAAHASTGMAYNDFLQELSLRLTEHSPGDFVSEEEFVAKLPLYSKKAHSQGSAFNRRLCKMFCAYYGIGFESRKTYVECGKLFGMSRSMMPKYLGRILRAMHFLPEEILTEAAQEKRLLSRDAWLDRHTDEAPFNPRNILDPTILPAWSGWHCSTRCIYLKNTGKHYGECGTCLLDGQELSVERTFFMAHCPDVSFLRRDKENSFGDSAVLRLLETQQRHLAARMINDLASLLEMDSPSTEGGAMARLPETTRLGVWSKTAERLLPRGPVVWTKGVLRFAGVVNKKPVATVRWSGTQWLARLPGWQWYVTPQMGGARFNEIPGDRIQMVQVKSFSSAKQAQDELEQIVATLHNE